MAKKAETQFRQSTVLPFLKTLKNSSYFALQQMAIHGDADYVLCCAGAFVWLELKKRGEKPRPLQAFKANWVKQTGGVAVCADPDNWPEIKARLLKLDGGMRD